MAMANSVEGRYPFLDHRVIEFCTKLPAEYKLRGLNEKYLLKKLMEGKLPESVLKRWKQAYRAPISKSFFTMNSPGYVDELLSEDSINSNNIFDAGSISKLMARRKTGTDFSELDDMAVAAILSTQLLIEIFLNKKIKPDTTGTLENCKIIQEPADRE